jgi:hypothetical protein
VHRWALNLVENGNRRRIFSHPETGEPSRSRVEVEALIEDLRGRTATGSGARVKDLAKHLLTPGVPGPSGRRAGETVAPWRITHSTSTQCTCASILSPP